MRVRVALVRKLLSCPHYERSFRRREAYTVAGFARCRPEGTVSEST